MEKKRWISVPFQGHIYVAHNWRKGSGWTKLCWPYDCAPNFVFVYSSHSFEEMIDL
jgi:hypothetical protein